MGGGARVLSYNITLWYNVARAILLIMKSDSVKLGKNMKRIRISKGLSQGDIFRLLGVSRVFISNIESGKTNPTLSTIVKLAKALGVSSDELLK
jgi:predicted transcriptional regulator